MGRATDAQKRAVRKYQQGQDNIMIRPPKDKGGAIRTAAAAAGQSVQAYVIQACFDRMQRDGFTPPAATTAGDATP
jgi:hypothetical protein